MNIGRHSAPATGTATSIAGSATSLKLFQRHSAPATETAASLFSVRLDSYAEASHPPHGAVPSSKSGGPSPEGPPLFILSGFFREVSNHNDSPAAQAISLNRRVFCCPGTSNARNANHTRVERGKACGSWPHCRGKSQRQGRHRHQSWRCRQFGWVKLQAQTCQALHYETAKPDSVRSLNNIKFMLLYFFIFRCSGLSSYVH